MKRAILTAMLLLLPMSAASPALAQRPTNELRELYELCSRFPHNSRCEGVDIPVVLDQRSGVEVKCLFDLGYDDQSGNCKIDITERGLTVYVERGEPIELLNNQRATTELQIPFDQVVGVTTYNFTGYIDFAITNLTVLTDSPDGANQSNVLNVLSGIGFLEGLKSSVQPDLARRTLRGEATDGAIATGAAVQQLLDTNACVQCNLQGADLRGADLDRANLEGANLQGANLQGAQLDGAYLVGANLDQANLTDADLEYARLTTASLIGANLTGATLKGANLLDANVQNANLTDANLRLPIALHNADLSNATLVNADLSGSVLINTNFQGANLTGANLSDTSISLSTIAPLFGTRDIFSLNRFGLFGQLEGVAEANLVGVNLKDANLSGADLEDAVLENTDLRGANLSSANLDDVDLTRSNLCGATMPDGSRSQQGCF
ncbi:pentapeptide repeat-containing protein [Oscillatoria sp. FACHB-1407]|uniref:pentapeptide repeat-containing protein n=1 Tax=Oscillatoria sp. FACHB-1407 TaxID=2692847 RepID=UPI001682F435|nr:pentapeptide repeat-containing protein [Oscillatoria sp. FACHB-1407]MBD2459449.1 pentapeptide repeat-containing protein [Oscillatoria sp. FACHB-1407]